MKVGIVWDEWWEPGVVPEENCGPRTERYDVPDDVVARCQAAEGEFKACGDLLSGIVKRQRG